MFFGIHIVLIGDRKVRVGLNYARIIAAASAVPGRIVTNDDQGRLLLNTPASVKAVASGEVTKVDL